MERVKVKQVFQGNLVHCLSVAENGFEILSNALIGIDEAGKIVFVEVTHRNLLLIQSEIR